MDALFTTQDETMLLHTFCLQKGESHRKHSHSYAHDAFLVKGKATFTIGQLSYTVDAPSTMRFPPETEHGFTAECDETVVVCAHRIVGKVN